MPSNNNKGNNKHNKANSFYERTSMETHLGKDGVMHGTKDHILVKGDKGEETKETLENGKVVSTKTNTLSPEEIENLQPKRISMVSFSSPIVSMFRIAPLLLPNNGNNGNKGNNKGNKGNNTRKTNGNNTRKSNNTHKSNKSASPATRKNHRRY